MVIDRSNWHLQLGGDPKSKMDENWGHLYFREPLKLGAGRGAWSESKKHTDTNNSIETQNINENNEIYSWVVVEHICVCFSSNSMFSVQLLCEVPKKKT